MKKIAINGFGRIGRLVFRQIIKDKNFQVVAINDLTAPNVLAHLLKYDSAQGKFDLPVEVGENLLIVGGQKIAVFSERDPEKLPWKKMGVDAVVESTGFFRSKEAAGKHLKAGAQKVLISAPGQGDMKTIVYGVNHQNLTSKDQIVSAASCTTNCLAPVVQVLHEKFKITRGFMTTVHAYTADQRLVDAPHSDLRRARAAAVNIVPTSTGAASAIGLVIPELKGRLDGIAMRVPIITGSVVDLVVELGKNVDSDQINQALQAASSESFGYTEEPIVSSDVIGSLFGSILDAKLTQTIDVDGKRMHKLVAWYDNESSYVAQYVRSLKHLVNL
ncbi:type I glyceraldehyde-3-phosphate dehydrogenase [Mycoplasma sp. ATU-Cv-508]|uniref:type I glyceraldehyde-3-phosphate dehydrogenase n=1 Tax=Mycoplasma sp. ATU-Cv-508 TaxID=2048001 RepID=UPI000FDD5C29